MKKVLSVLLTLAMIFSLIPMGTFTLTANALTEGYYTYTVTDSKATITDVSSSISGDVTIPSTLGGYTVTRVGSYAFDNCTALTSITIGDSVTSIGSYAFENCTALTSITIGNSVTSIGWRVFANCTGLTSITIPDSVTSIGNYAFIDCTGLTSVTIPNSVTSIGEGAFSYCTGLTSITIPDSVTSIAMNAFENCTGLTSITVNSGNTVYHSAGNCLINTESKTVILGCINSVIPNDGSVISIGDQAFYNCTRLTSFAIPDSITNIGYYAFYGCTGLTSITIPDSVTSIGSMAFYDTGYYNNEDNWEDDVLYIGNHLIEAKYSKTGAYTIKDETLTIAACAFWECTELTSVTIPNSVTSIGSGTFFACISLTDIIIPDSITSIGESAFLDCGLTSITIPDSVTSIGDFAFNGCSEFTSIIIPDGVTNIGEGVFGYCWNLTDITIPNSVTSIGDYAFEECESLIDVWYSGSEEDKENISFADGNDYLLNATWHYDKDDDDESYYTYTVTDSKATITDVSSSISGDVTIPSTLGGYPVTSIGTRAFAWCENITSITIPDGVISIDEGAFDCCTGVQTITIPDSVTSIGERAFAWCENLTSITIPGGVTSIGESMFYYCSKLTSVTLPSSVTNIGRSAFEGCASITSIVIPNGVTSISEYAFFDCQALTSITLPDSITNIGRHTFLDTGYYLNEDNWEKGALYIGKHLVKINTSISDEYTVKEGTLTIAVYAFAGQEELTGITLPDSVKSIGEGAFEECLSLANVCFGGSEEDKENINFADGNDCLLNATWYYNVCTDGHTYSYFYDSWCNNCSWSRGDREPTTLHALEMQQNMLGITTLPYGHFDMNFDKKVDSTDLVILQTLILGL